MKYLTTDIGGFEVEVAYTVDQGSRGSHTLPNGDPGNPDDPIEVEIHEVSMKEGLVQLIGVDYLEAAKEKVFEHEIQ